MLPFSIVGAVLGFLPFQAAIFQGTSYGFWIIMALLFIMGFCNNICYSSIIGVTSQLPGKYTTLFLIGSGAAGLFMSILREIMTLVFPGSNSFGVLVFFLVAALLLIWCVFLHLIFIKSAFYKNFNTGPEDRLLENTQDTEGSYYIDYVDHEQAEDKFVAIQKRDFGTLFKVLKEIKFHVFLIVLCYIQMYTVFPGIMLQKSMPELSASNKVVSMNMVFSIFFIVGKKIAQYRHLYNKTIVTLVVIFRFVLMACFMIQAITSGIPVFNTAWFGYLNILLFGLTNGFVTCALFILAPEAVDSSKKEIAGFVSVFGLTFGILIGTFTALPFKTLNIHN